MKLGISSISTTDSFGLICFQTVYATGMGRFGIHQIFRADAPTAFSKIFGNLKVLDSLQVYLDSVAELMSETENFEMDSGHCAIFTFEQIL